MCLAVPMKVLSIDGDLAEVDQAGVRLKVNLMICDQRPELGDFVIVHAGFAIRRIDPDEAQESLRLFEELLNTNGQTTGSQG